MPARLKSAIPVLFVADVTKSAAFCRDKLGFGIDFLYGEPPFYAGVSRDSATLHLRFVHEPPISKELKDDESLLAAFIVVENVSALFAEYQAKSVSFQEPLHQEAWGGPTFTVVDLDDNSICFSQG